MTKQELIITDARAPLVCEAFGMSEALYDMLYKSMHEFFERVSDYDNLPPQSKVERLQRYLESQEFKDLNFNPATPNEWFAFGYIFNQIVVHISGKERGDIDIGGLIKAVIAARVGEEGGVH